MFHGREKSVKSTNVARNKRMSTDSSSQLESRRMAKMALVLLLLQTPRSRSPRALTPRNVDGTRPSDQRWASADLSQGPAHKSRPGLFTRQGPNRGAVLRQADRQTCRAMSSARTVRGSVISSLAFPPRSPTSELRPLSFFLCRITFSFLFHARLSKPAAVSLTAE